MTEVLSWVGKVRTTDAGTDVKSNPPGTRENQLIFRGKNDKQEVDYCSSRNARYCQ